MTSGNFTILAFSATNHTVGEGSIVRGGVRWIRRDDGTFRTASFWLATHVTVPSDYGDGKTELAVFRASDANRHVLPGSTGSEYRFRRGIATDLPVPADYGGDGRADIAVFRGGERYIASTLVGSSAIRYYGLATDCPHRELGSRALGAWTVCTARPPDPMPAPGLVLSCPNETPVTAGTRRILEPQFRQPFRRDTIEHDADPKNTRSDRSFKDQHL